MTAKILLTGASGLIGFRILLAALEAGHNVRYTVRSEKKAQLVASNPAVKKLGITPGTERLSPVVLPELTVDGCFDEALKGVTHIIHTGSPVPVAHFDPVSQVFQPTIEITANLLKSALKAPTVQRVVITSSVVANLGTGLGPGSASTRTPLPDPLPETFDDVMVAYVIGKLVELRDTDIFVKTQSPHFTISHVMPGYVFGRNELALTTAMMQSQNSSNNFLMAGLLGGELPFPIHGTFAHIDDVAEVHLKVAFEDAYAGKDFGVGTKVDYSTIFDYAEERFPEAVKAGFLKKGTVPTLPVEYDTSDAEAMLGKFKDFRSAVVDVASQYLELRQSETEKKE